MRGAGVDEPAVHVHEADEVASVFGNEPVLLLTSPKGGLSAKLSLFSRLFLERVGNGCRKTFEAGFEDVVVSPLSNTLDSHFFGSCAGNQNKRNFDLEFSQKLQGLKGV